MIQYEGELGNDARRLRQIQPQLTCYVRADQSRRGFGAFRWKLKIVRGLFTILDTLNFLKYEGRFEFFTIGQSHDSHQPLCRQACPRWIGQTETQSNRSEIARYGQLLTSIYRIFSNSLGERQGH